MIDGINMLLLNISLASMKKNSIDYENLKKFSIISELICKFLKKTYLSIRLAIKNQKVM